MGVEILGVGRTMANLRRTEKRTSKAMLRALRAGARDIAELAREYAPVDEGDLEDAIVVAETTQKFMGRDRNVEYVGVDPSRLGPGYSKYGFRYDIWTHEAAYNLGPGSQAKQASSGKQVGPKYLSRALDELEPGIKTKMQAIANKVGD